MSSRDAEILRLRSLGQTYVQIAERLGGGITRHTVRHVCDAGQTTSPVAFPMPAMRQMARKSDWGSLIEQAKLEMLEDIRAEVQERPTPQAVQPTVPSGILVEISPVDLHLGKRGWREETGADYDVTIAERVFTAAIKDIIAKSAHLQPERYALIVGNDLLQTDNEQGTTTAGTHVDVDGRYVRSFRRARAIHSWAIQRLAERAPVSVVIVPGNHDRLTAWHIGEVLGAEFADDHRVSVDNSPTPRKYIRHGVNLIGFVHGDQEKQDALPLIMAQERPEDWAETTWREFHTGHKHKAKETRYVAGDSFAGVRVRILPSLCSPDAWHAQQGYVSEKRACEAYIWDRTTGYYGHLSSNVNEEAA